MGGNIFASGLGQCSIHGLVSVGNEAGSSEAGANIRCRSCVALTEWHGALAVRWAGRLKLVEEQLSLDFHNPAYSYVHVHVVVNDTRDPVPRSPGLAAT